MRVLLTAEADEELVTAARFYASEASAKIGQAFVHEIDRACKLLAEQPLIGIVWRGPVRRLALRRFPFNVIYRVESTEIQIIAIAHQRRRPGYWVA